MADLVRLERALRNADAAGDTAAARTLAAEYQRVREAGADRSEASPLRSTNATEQGLSGLNEGIANVAGAPIDAAAWALDKVGLGASEPVMGSDWLKARMSDGAMIAPEDEDYRFARRVGQEVGSSVLPAGAVLGTAAKGVKAAGMVGQALNAARTAPGTFAAAELGSSIASGVGAATAQQIAPGSKTAEFVGQMAGALSPSVAAAGVRGALRGGETGRKSAVKAIDDFAAAGSTPSLGQATGSNAINAIETGVGSVPFGHGVMRKAGERQSQGFGAAVNSLSDRLGKGTATAAGRAMKTSIERGFLPEFRRRSSKMFDAVPVANDKRVGAGNVLDTLRDATSSAKGAEALTDALADPRMRAIADAASLDAKGDTLPFGALKRLRTIVGEKAFNGGLNPDIDPLEMRRLYGAISRDLENAARSEGPDAIRKWNRANTYHASNATAIEDVLNSLVRKATPEDAYTFGSKGDNGATRIGTIRSRMKKDEWREVASAALKRMGRATNSNQDDLGEVFSTNTFLTNWNRLDDASKDAMFKGIDGVRPNLDRIAAAASRIREGSQKLANPSGTAPLLLNAGGTGAVAVTSAFNPAIAAVMAGGLVGTGATAKLLTSPRMIHWLALSTTMKPERIPGLVARMRTTAKDDPEMIEAVDALEAAIGQQSGGVAAE